MRKSGAVLGFFMVMGFSGILLFGCSDSDNSIVPAGIPTNRIYVMSAENGTLDPVALSTGERTVSDTAQSWEYKLTLKNVSEDTLWYTDRPDRKSGTETTEYFVQTLWPKVYVEIAPNAVLDGWIPPNESNDGLFCILEEPQYNAQTKELTFNVTLLDSTMDNKHPENPLTINDAKITILNNAEDQHSWSSAQVAATAYYETTETDGVYKLHLNNIFPDLFNLGNAPNRGAYIYPNKFFVESWPARFGDDPPNASMTSYSEDGTLNIHLLTLSDPVYDADTAILTYTATSLNGDTEQNQTQLISPTLFIDDAASYTIKVTNTNDSPLYVVGWNNAAPKTTFETDSGKNSYMLAKKGGDKNNHTFQVTIPWASGNVFGCWEDPKDTSITDVDAMQKICTMTEFTITPTIDGTYKGQLAIAGDLSCVNYISKPARYKAVGGKACNPATCEAGTDFDPAKIYPSPPAECPTKMVGETCLSAGFFCDPQKNPGGGTALNGDKDFCDKYKQTLTDMVAYCKENSLPCAAAEGSNTLDVYYCGTAGGWLSTAAGKPYCAALNRGLGYKDVVDQGEKRKPDFYTTEPYNAYSQFVHKTAGDIYGFSYDDYSGEASPYNSSGELGTQGSCGIEVEYGPKSE